jgi:hypothetical protein
MAKLTADLLGAPDGEVYPRVFKAGEECPPELMEAAISLGAVAKSAAKAKADAGQLAAEEAAKAEAERLAAEEAAKAEAERLAAEEAAKAEAERLAAEEAAKNA